VCDTVGTDVLEYVMCVRVWIDGEHTHTRKAKVALRSSCHPTTQITRPPRIHTHTHTHTQRGSLSLSLSLSLTHTPTLSLSHTHQELPSMSPAPPSHRIKVSSSSNKGEGEGEEDDVIAQLRSLPPDMRCGGCGSKVKFVCCGVWGGEGRGLWWGEYVCEQAPRSPLRSPSTHIFISMYTHIHPYTTTNSLTPCTYTHT
jgi:hypothetical protein